VVTPYLHYYTVLSLVRAVCFTLPEHGWKGGQLIESGHARAIQGAIAHVRGFRADAAAAMEAQVEQLKTERELISYRAPSPG